MTWSGQSNTKSQRLHWSRCWKLVWNAFSYLSYRQQAFLIAQIATSRKGNTLVFNTLVFIFLVTPCILALCQWNIKISFSDFLFFLFILHETKHISSQIRQDGVSRYQNLGGIFYFIWWINYASGSWGDRAAGSVCAYVLRERKGRWLSSRTLACFHGKAGGKSGSVQLICSRCLLEMAAVLPIYCIVWALCICQKDYSGFSQCSMSSFQKQLS